jgi:cytochrome P450
MKRTTTPDLFSAEVHYNPYPAYDDLRRNHPIYYDPTTDFWTVSRYSDVSAVLKDPQQFSSSLASFERSMLGADGPAHTRVRRIVGRMFNAAGTAALESRIRLLAQARIDQIAVRGTCDLICDFASPVPLEVVAWLLEIDDAHLADLRRWSGALIASGEPALSEEARRGAADSVRECRDFLTDHMERRSNRHRDSPLELLVADREDRLTVDELIDVGMLLVVAGTETTTNLVGSAAAILTRDMPLERTLRTDTLLIPQFIEEILRYEAPVQRVVRRAVGATAIAGVQIPRDARIQLLIGSANRDPAIFLNADEIQMDRQPNNHLSFGIGPHFCLGARLARLEARIMLEELIKRLPAMAAASSRNAVEFSPSFVVRGLARLELMFSVARQ